VNSWKIVSRWLESGGEERAGTAAGYAENDNEQVERAILRRHMINTTGTEHLPVALGQFTAKY